MGLLILELVFIMIFYLFKILFFLYDLYRSFLLIVFILIMNFFREDKFYWKIFFWLFE